MCTGVGDVLSRRTEAVGELGGEGVGVHPTLGLITGRRGSLTRLRARGGWDLVGVPHSHGQHVDVAAGEVEFLQGTVVGGVPEMLLRRWPGPCRGRTASSLPARRLS